MVLRIRLGSDDDEDGNERLADETDDEHDTVRGWFVNPTDLGGFFVRAALVSFAITVLSILGLVLVLLDAADEPFVDQPTVEDPIIAYVWLLSLTATALSTFGYAAWSFWKQRQLRTQSTTTDDSSWLTKPVRTFKIATTDSTELDEYEQQVQKTVIAVVLGVFVGYLPIRIVLGAVVSL